jgi:hypothetical protein
MENLIKALTIFLKYQNNKWPTHCEHDVLHVVDISKDEVSSEDQEALEELGFLWDYGGGWISYKYGSA